LDLSGEWPMPRFDAARTACNPDGKGLRSGAVYWMLDAGQSVTMSDESLYNVTPTSNRTLLTRRDPSTAKRTFGACASKLVPDLPPTIESGQAYLADYSGVYSFDATSGEREWQTEGLSNVNYPVVSGSSVFISTSRDGDDRAFVQSRASNDGTVRWEETLPQEAIQPPAFGAGAVFISSQGVVQALEHTTGEIRFSEEYEHELLSPPTVDGGAVYVLAEPYAGATSLLKLDADTGARVWETPVDSTFVVGEEMVYVRRAHRIVALNKNNGREATTTTVDAAPVAASGPILYATHGRSLYAFDRENGLEERWSLTLPEIPSGAPDSKGIQSVTPVDGAVYAWNGSALVGIGSEERLTETERSVE
jgi:outer membrane protein assembly factor BamB